MENDVILGAWHGGLGDQLQFSTLPEEFYKQQGRETYLVDGSEFRNKEIYDLVWGHNPYIKGVKEGKRNAGDIPEIELENKTGNWISNWEALHGLQPTNIRPKIYYKPKYDPHYKGKVLVDLSSITINHHNEGYGYDLNEVEKTYLELRKKNHNLVGIRFNKNVVETNIYHPPVDEVVEVRDIFHYCDLMNSASKIICFYSGSMALAAAIQRTNPSLKILCITSPSVYNSDRTQKLGIFYFDYVNYIVTN